MTENIREKFEQLMAQHNELKLRYDKLNNQKYHLLVALENLGYGNLGRVESSIIDDELLRQAIRNIYDQLQELVQLREQKYPKLTESDWEFWCDSSVYDLYPILRGNLFHRTSISGFRGIQQAGHIIFNDGRFATKYPQTVHYYGFSKQYISLFDFSSGTDEERISSHQVWAPFFSDYEPATIILKLDRNHLEEKLIPNSAAPKLGEDNYKGYIPYVEAWYPKPIPISAIESYLVTCFSAENTSKLIVGIYSREDIAEFEHLLEELEKSECES